MKVVSLVPQDKSKKQIKALSFSANQISLLEPKKPALNINFDIVFPTNQKEAEDVGVNKPLTLIAVCNTDAFEGVNAIANNIEAFTSTYFTVNKSESAQISYVSISAEKTTDLVNNVELNNATECSELIKSILVDLNPTNNNVIYYSIEDKTKLELFYIPLMSTVVDDIEEFTSNPSSNTNNQIIKQILLSLKNSNNNVVLDFRFGFNCGSIENQKLYKSIDMFKNFITQSKGLSQQVDTEQKPEKKQARKSNASQIKEPKSEISAAPTVKSAIPGKANSWKKFVYRPVIENISKGKARRDTSASSTSKPNKKIDRERLIHVARKYATDPRATKEDLEGILAELDNQIQECVEYHAMIQGSDKPEDQKDRSKRGLIKNLNDDVRLLRENEAKYAKSERDHKLHYLELKSFNKSDESADHNIMIGDKEDYTIALEILKEQVDDLETELSFLRVAFPEVAAAEEEDFGDDEEEEEEEEEALAIEPAPEESKLENIEEEDKLEQSQEKIEEEEDKLEQSEEKLEQIKDVETVDEEEDLAIESLPEEEDIDEEEEPLESLHDSMQ